MLMLFQSLFICTFKAAVDIDLKVYNRDPVFQNSNWKLMFKSRIQDACLFDELSLVEMSFVEMSDHFFRILFCRTAAVEVASIY